MARVPPILRSAWARLRELAHAWRMQLLAFVDALRPPAYRRGKGALRAPHEEMAAAARAARAPKEATKALHVEFEAPQRSVWLARTELVVLVLLSFAAAIDRGHGSHGGPLAGFVVLAVALLALGTFLRGQLVLLRRLGFAVVLLLLPTGSHLAVIAAAFATSLAGFTLVDSLGTLRGLPGLAPYVPVPPRVLRATPSAYASVAALLTAWSLHGADPSPSATTLLTTWIVLALFGGCAFAVYLAKARALELGAAPRAWAAALAFAPCVVASGFAVGIAHASALGASAAAFVTASALAAFVAESFDALRGARRARRLATLAMFGTPACLLLALIAADEPSHRPAIAVVSFLVGTAIAAWNRELADLAGVSRAPWTTTLAEARGSSERRHPFDAMTRALERVQHAPLLGRAPALIAFETGERIEVDRAGYLHRRDGAYPANLVAVAQDEPFATLREDTLLALEVRRPDLRPLLAWLDADDLVAACIGVADGEPLCALLLPRGQRETPLALEELFEAKRLADVLAGHLAILEERRQSGARVDRIEKLLAEERDRVGVALHRGERRGHARQVETERVASDMLPVLVAPRSRLVQEALERAAARGQGTYLVTTPGHDGLANLARAHASSPRRSEAFVVVDGVQTQQLLYWQRPETSPLLAADRGTLVLQDVRAFPLAIQRFIAHVHAERRLPDGDAEALDFVLVLTSREPPERLLATSELATELLERLAGAAPLVLPALAERSEDLRALLVAKLAHEGMRAYGRPLGITDAAFAMLVERMFLAGETELDALVIALARVAASGVVQVADLQRVLGANATGVEMSIELESAVELPAVKESSRPQSGKSVASKRRSTRHRR